VNAYEETTFLNVDLEVLARTPLDGLVAAFGKKVDVLYLGKWGRRYGAHVEVSGSGYQDSAERLIRRFVAMISALPKSKRTLWNGAQSREFNVGIEAAQKARPFELRLRRETLEAIASVDGQLVFTVYAPRLYAPSTATGRKMKQPPNPAIEPAAPDRTHARRGSSRDR
jgi:hypothetical protein